MNSEDQPRHNATEDAIIWQTGQAGEIILWSFEAAPWSTAGRSAR